MNLPVREKSGLASTARFLRRAQDWVATPFSENTSRSPGSERSKHGERLAGRVCAQVELSRIRGGAIRSITPKRFNSLPNSQPGPPSHEDCRFGRPIYFFRSIDSSRKRNDAMFRDEILGSLMTVPRTVAICGASPNSRARRMPCESVTRRLCKKKKPIVTKR